MALYHQPWPPCAIPAAPLDLTCPVEEEKTRNYSPERFYPIRLGQLLNGRYQMATKLGYGANSTVWLARDLNRWKWSAEKYVAIKVKATKSSKTRASAEDEINILQHINRTNPKHNGWHFIRKLTDTFHLESPYGSHPCLVLEPLREPLWLYCSRYIGGVIPPGILKILLQMILLALDYLHTGCYVIHADLKPDNIMIRIEDPKMFEKDAIEEYNNPLPEKQLDDRIIYLSRNNFGPLSRPTGIIQLVDFDLAVRSTPGKLHYGAIQGEKYRAPEVILNSGYSYSADIWSLGVMLSDLLEKKSLFHPVSFGDGTGYVDLTHLGQITALLGPAPQNLLTKGRRSASFYHESGELKDPGRVPSNFSLESTLTCMAGEEKRRFIHFVKRMITWHPEDRSTAKELLADPWLYIDFPQD
ncbi:probable dis1-suppressing protein kinase dsk1 [Fusarium fujikuroi IMI 58289]|uniref:non-specific serine/threonine protein kinase n=1 Tax=Gibberella fujikuroi (strain CBS 195.34 / IMI 58289 / NRRL A-6831) TaxID=1279085 RepID=S0EJD5_GIBF5|nr:probable dis1-suppressing protein kinase dsk1 [Fusarium fujikuroi IMI 58289]KLP12574.1 putative dis1-suppressing protein kinase dsk1 [Fusarium fujikuroi]CCT74899.1 probable dis1-suppressing protein kinase dsk1 [Fusarium fujikuroi IMI 58289]SCO04383.1 probable dis1-suppressing protein kinase dsk1 [Fusarium fujikuroi]SCO57751.1 probable dis1-suppressing protein kinase dsk1 [Fusarium fujikuroi]